MSYVLWALGAIVIAVAALSVAAIRSDIQIIIVIVSFGFGVVCLGMASISRKLDRLASSHGGSRT